MKRIKKTLALLLAAVMVLATGTTAAAAGGTGSLTIKGTKAPADGKPNNVYAYRMFTADVEGASPNEVVTYTMEESFADFFKNLLGNEYASAEASDPDLKNAAADYVADVQLGESTGKVEFAKKALAYIREKEEDDADYFVTANVKTEQAAVEASRLEMR